MDVVSGCNIRCRATDGLGILDDRFAFVDGADGHLVTLVDLRCRKGTAWDGMSCFNRNSGHGNIVVLRQQDAGWFRHPMFLPCVR